LKNKCNTTYIAPRITDPWRYCGGVPDVAQYLRVKVPPQVFTAKCSEPQANDSNGVGGGSGVAKPASLRTETGYKAKRRVRLPYKPVYLTGTYGATGGRGLTPLYPISFRENKNKDIGKSP